MNNPPQPSRNTRTMGAVLVVGCVLCALANLPRDPLPPGWLLAFLVPGALLGALHRWSLAPWQRALLAAALQTAACWLALEFVGPMTRPAALACTILPPLGFAMLRAQETDHALALFLSFCVLLVGVILDGVHPGLLSAYVAIACLSLRYTSRAHAETHGRRARSTTALRTPRALLPATTLLVSGVLMVMFALDRVLAALPSPTRDPAARPAASSGNDGARRTGLDDSFVLDGGSGLLGELTGEQLVRVTSSDGAPLPTDLYLRSGFFSAPGLDRWQLGALDLTAPSSPDRHQLRQPVAGAPLRSLMIQRYAGAQQFVFVPPGACVIDGLPNLAVDAAREWVRQTGKPTTDVYDVAWQHLPPPRGLPLDPRGPDLGLLQLPNTLDRDRFAALLQQWRLDAEPQTAMARLAAGLAAHCRYDRLEPTGPHAHAIENFLFSPGDRRGYCMHFASAAALLLRLQGIPCRIGVGLYGGERDRRDANARMFGSQHAHAWVEVPFQGRGYVVFDPTPPSERGQSTPTRRPESDEERDPAANANAAGRALFDDALAFVLQPWFLALLLMLAVASSLLPARRSERRGAEAVMVPKSARRALGRLLQALAAAGLPRARRQTLEAYAAEMAKAGRLLPSVKAAFLAYQEVRFGGRAFDAERERSLVAATHEVTALGANS